MTAILHVTIPPDIIKAMPSDCIREAVITDENPWSAIVRSKVPATITVQIILVTVVNYIIRTAYGYRKTPIRQINKVGTCIDNKSRPVANADM